MGQLSPTSATAAPVDRRAYVATPGLRRALEETGVTQSRIARELETSTTVVSDMVNGRKRTRLGRAEQIASIVGRPRSELFEPVGP